MKIVSMFLAVVLMVSIASIALARGAPTKQKAFSQATVSVHVAPAVANVPPMTNGYDVICNLTANPRLASANHYTDISDELRLSPTVAWHSIQSASTSCGERSGPSHRLVMLA